MKKQYYVYIATNKINSVLYTGVTNDIERRIYQHKHKINSGFTSRYNINKLVFIEIFNNPNDAIKVEKKIKGWLREKKLNLIKEKNPKFLDLSDEII